MNLGTFARAYPAAGPVLTATLDVTRDTEHAAHEIDVRWRDLRKELPPEIPTEDLEQAGTRLEAVTGLGGEWSRTVVAGNGEVRLDRLAPGRIGPDFARWGPFPSLVRLLTADARRVVHLVVEIDRVGADITVSAPEGRWVETVDGETHLVHKTRGGGWAELTWQHRVEKTWEQNVKSVAERVTRLADSLNPEVIAVAGDPKARALLQDEAEERIRPLLRHLDGGGRGENPDGRLPLELPAVLEEITDRHAREAADLFGMELAHRTRAAAGLAATVAALQKAQVETLLIPPNWTLDEAAWYGPDPVVFGLKSDEVAALGDPDPQQAPVDDLVIRAAVATDVDLVVMPDHILALDGEPSAILRWADPATPHDSVESGAGG